MATKEIMPIHKALAELKILDDRIKKETLNSMFCAPNKHSSDKVYGISVEDFKKNAQSAYDKITDLINRQEALKKAVTLSNAVTTVDIAGETYTAAEAIWMKNHGIEGQSRLIEIMAKQYREANAEVNKKNGDDLDERADQYVTAIYGSKDTKSSTADIEKLRNDFIESNTYEIIDPLDVNAKIEAIRNKLDAFMAEVDSALSVSNALTEITIEY